jgi:hypothetical protein
MSHHVLTLAWLFALLAPHIFSAPLSAAAAAAPIAQFGNAFAIDLAWAALRPEDIPTLGISTIALTFSV